MSAHIKRPTLSESLDAILRHDIRHLQFNPGSVNIEGSLADKLAQAPMVREEIRKRGMTISVVGGPANMVAVEEAQRDQAIDKLKLLISACGPMGTSVIATCTGSRDPDSMWHKHPDNETEQAWRVLQNTLEQVLPVAETAGVIIAFEPEVNNVVNMAQKGLRLIDEMASKSLKIVMDASNLFGRAICRT